MKVSNTYRRGRMQASMNRMAESSSDLIDYRTRLVYMNIRLKHPSWHPTIVRALASQRALFVTIFQAPMEWLGRTRMKIYLMIKRITLKTKKK